MEVLFRSFSMSFVFVQLMTTTTESKYVEGVISTPERWSFLARFCFLSEQGKLHYVFTFSPEFQPQKLLLYYDGSDQWSAVYKKGLSCVEMTSPPHIVPENNQDIILDVPEVWSGCQKTRDNVTKAEQVRCEATRTFRSSRERWWYLAMSRCQNSTIPGIFAKYSIHMTNGADLFHKEFSADEFTILEVDIAFFLALLVILILAIKSAYELKKKLLLHTTYKMYITSLSFETLHVFIMCIAYGKYANSGVENHGLKTFGRALNAVSFLIFILLLLLMAKGFTITRGHISTGGSVKMTIFMTLYTIIYIILFIYETLFFDPGEVLYIYESPPGYGLLAMQFIAWIYFCYACFFTIKHHPEKSKFYTPFFFSYSIWFLIGPVFVLIAYFGLPKYQRERIVNGIDLGISFLAQSYLLFLTRPQISNKNFPFHVRTSQIGVMKVDEKDNRLSADPYFATTEFLSQGPDFTSLFTVTKAVYTLPGHQDVVSASSQGGGTSSRQSEQSSTIDKFPNASNSNPIMTSH